AELQLWFKVSELTVALRDSFRCATACSGERILARRLSGVLEGRIGGRTGTRTLEPLIKRHPVIKGLGANFRLRGRSGSRLTNMRRSSRRDGDRRGERSTLGSLGLARRQPEARPGRRPAD